MRDERRWQEGTKLALEALGSSGLALVRFQRNVDTRGWLGEIYNSLEAARLGLPDFGQDNVSQTTEVGVVRGLHFQRPPDAQAKLFRVVRGRVFNVAVDLRPASFGRLDERELSDADSAWFYLPIGFAHGFQALEAEVQVHYKLAQPFVADALAAVDFDDPGLAVDWPLPIRRDLISKRDLNALPLAAFASVFVPSVCGVAN